MIEETPTSVDEPNRWRLDTPGHQGWTRTARPDDPNKYVMISADCHCQEPGGSLAQISVRRISETLTAHRNRCKRR